MRKYFIILAVITPMLLAAWLYVWVVHGSVWRAESSFERYASEMQLS